MSAQPKVAAVHADWIGRTFAHDPDLKLPRRPRLIPELLIEPIEPDGVLFYGGAETQVIRGKSARTHLLALLPLLDGRRTLADLAAAYPQLSPEQVASMVSLLHSRGLLEDGIADEPVDPGQREVHSWLGRFVDVTRLNVHRGQAWQALRSARVQIIGEGTRALLLQALCERSGLGQVFLANAVADDDSVPILLSTPGEWPELAGLRERIASGRPTPLVLVSPTTLLLGPTLVKGQTACPHCVSATVRAVDRGVPFDAPEALLGLAAQHLVTTLSRVFVPEPQASCLAFTQAPGRIVRHQLHCAPTPGCHECGLAAVARLDAPGARASWVFHTMTAFPNRDLLSPKAHQNHYRIANIKLAREQEQTALPRTIELLRALPEATVAPEGAGIGLAALSALLLRSAGFHGDKEQVRRIAPTGGDLGSPQLFVAARRVEGVSPGLYRYDAVNHALQRVVAAGAYELPIDAEEAADCIVLGMGDASKVMRKYRAFGLRLIHFDAGVALGYASLVARTLGLTVHETRRFDPARVLDALRIPKQRGLVPTFLLGLSAGSPGPGDDPVTLEAVMEMMVDECLKPRSGAGPSWHQFREGDRDPLSLPSLAALDAVLLKRRACRDFAGDGLTGNAVARVVAAGMRAVGARSPVGTASALSARVYVARPLQDFAAGVYAADPFEPERLVRLPQSIDDETMRRLVIQDSLGTAPVAVVMVADLERALGTRGAVGYVDTLVDAGLAVSRMWLSAVALGLAGCPAGGVIADPARAVHGLALHQSPLLGFFFGRAAGQ